MSSPPSLQAEGELLDAAGLLEVAAAIGGRLAREAIWHGERCNWIGGRLGAGAGGAVLEHEAALDGTLYEGTAGVALFLAELHAITGEADARRTALGAIRQAIGAMPAPGRALYTGSAGVALAAARIGRLLPEPALVDAARELVPDITGPTAADEELDLLNGTSGTIVALLALADLLDDRGLVDVAVRLGDELVAAGREDAGGLSWKSPGVPTAPSLTGLSHGAAGIAMALVELAAATGEQRFAAAARAGFDYERSTFDPAVGNWPDLRELFPDRPTGEPGHAAFWCHGGPGIALSRLTALERLGGARWRAEAEAGLEVSLQSVERALRHGGGNFSLCHGAAGNAEIVTDGARVLGGAWAGSASAAVAVASAGVALHGAEGPWPGGAGSREAVGLMLGIAGTGYFMLRAAGAPVPSVMRPEPKALAAGH
jgi:lantibiotic modifying enzyme